MLNRWPTPASQSDIVADSCDARQGPADVSTAIGERRFMSGRSVAHGITIDGMPSAYGATWYSENVILRPDGTSCQPAKFDADGVVPGLMKKFSDGSWNFARSRIRDSVERSRSHGVPGRNSSASVYRWPVARSNVYVERKWLPCAAPVMYAPYSSPSESSVGLGETDGERLGGLARREAARRSPGLRGVARERR